MKYIGRELEHAVAELTGLLASLNQQELNAVPFAGSWTAGQLGEHLLKSYNGVLEMLTRETKPTEREPDEHVAQLKYDFLDLSTKMKSPEFIKPRDVTYDSAAQQASLLHTRAKLISAIDSLDETLICTMVPFPVYGLLTRLELYHFMLYHTQRHIHQLKGIVAVIKL